MSQCTEQAMSFEENTQPREDEKLSELMDQVSNLLAGHGITLTRPSVQSLYAKWSKKNACSIQRSIEEVKLDNFPRQELASFLLPKFLQEDLILKTKEHILGIRSHFHENVDYLLSGTKSQRIKIAENAIFETANTLAEKPGGPDAVRFVQLIHDLANKNYEQNTLALSHGIGWLTMFHKAADFYAASFSSNLSKYFATKMASLFSHPSIITFIEEGEDGREAKAIITKTKQEIEIVFGRCFCVGKKATQQCWNTAKEAFILRFDNEMAGNFGKAMDYVKKHADVILFRFFCKSLENQKNHFFALDQTRINSLNNIFGKDVSEFRLNFSEACSEKRMKKSVLANISNANSKSDIPNERREEFLAYRFQEEFSAFLANQRIEDESFTMAFKKFDRAKAKKVILKAKKMSLA